MSDPTEPTRGATRREFLGQAAGALAGAALAGASAERVYAVAPPKVLGANDRVNFALIGAGMRGPNHLTRLKQLEREGKANVRLAAVCEIYDRRKDYMKSAAELPVCHHNYEDILADPSIDAVVIATPDHWHKRMSIDAMTAGKDVYCEKPMTLYWEEARDVLMVQRLTGRVYQVGAQSVSQDVWWRARDFIGDGKNGLIGKLLQFQTSYNRNVPGGDWNYTIYPDCTPKTLDWDRWIGSATKRPFDVERYFRFRKYWDYSGGLATDLMYHQLSHISAALGFPFPRKVSAIGGNYVHFDREVPDTLTMLVEMENACTGTIFATAGNDKNTEEMIRGEHGTITFEGSDVVFAPQSAWMDAVREKVKEIPDAVVTEATVGDKTIIKSVRLKAKICPNDSNLHMDNFIRCVRTGEKPPLDAEAGFRVMATIALGVKAYREGSVCRFDPKAMKLA